MGPGGTKLFRAVVIAGAALTSCDRTAATSTPAPSVPPVIADDPDARAFDQAENERLWQERMKEPCPDGSTLKAQPCEYIR